MNLLQLVNQLKAESGRSGPALTSLTGLSLGDSRLVSWTQQAWDYIQTITDWRWMRKTATGPVVDSVTTYAPAVLNAPNLRSFCPETDEYFPTAVPTGSTGPVQGLRWIPYERFRQYFIISQNEQAAPQYWSIDPQGNMLVGPLPLGSWDLTFDYYETPQALTDADDVPAMPSHHHMLIVWRALMRVGNFDSAPEVFAEGQSSYSRMLAVLLQEQGPRYSIAARPLA